MIYLGDFTAEKIVGFLLNRENLPKLEGILRENVPELERIQDGVREGIIDKGKRLKSIDALELGSRVIKDVNEFLEVEDIPEPRCVYLKYMMLNPTPYFLNLFLKLKNSDIDNSKYIFKSKKILINKDWDVDFAHFFAHEYTHHVQYCLAEDSMTSESLDPFVEGHARGVQRRIAEMYAKEHELFKYQTLDWTMGEVKYVYWWACEVLKEEPKTEILRFQSTVDYYEASRWRSYGTPTGHALGNTFFLLQEMEKGDGIYKDVLKGDFSIG